MNDSKKPVQRHALVRFAGVVQALMQSMSHEVRRLAQEVAIMRLTTRGNLILLAANFVMLVWLAVVTDTLSDAADRMSVTLSTIRQQ